MSMYHLLAQDMAIWTNWDRVWDLWVKGGNTMWFLLLLSVMGLAFTLERLVRLRRSLIVPRGLPEQLDTLWKLGDYAGIRDLCEKSNSTLGDIIRFVVRHRTRPVSEINAGAADIAARELRPHFRRAYPLLIVATLAPLLGLFGTVVGMMEAFEQFRTLGEHGDPSIFAGSISKALITTIVGLAIAMPALAAYHFFKTRTNKLGDLLEDDVSDLVTEWLIPEEADAVPTR